MDPDRPFAGDELEAGTDRGLRLAQELGGSMEYCHGVGLRLAHLMADELGTGLDVLRDMKKALDPCNILNPGKLGL
jgi:FAD/FMN-containing dehydrogenase